MGSPFFDGTVFQDYDFIGMHHRTDAVGDNNLGGMLQAAQGVLNQLFRFHVQCGSGVIQHKDRVFLGQRPCYADALFLPAGQPHTPFTDNRVVLFIHLLDEIRRLGISGCTDDGKGIYPFPFSKLYVFHDSIREKEHILHDK